MDLSIETLSEGQANIDLPTIAIGSNHPIPFAVEQRRRSECGIVIREITRKAVMYAGVAFGADSLLLRGTVR